MKVVELEKAERRYGSVKAIDKLSLSIEAGKVVGLLGMNGAGKSTCMRLLMGLIKAEQGSVRVFGKDSWSMAPADRRRIGYLSEKDYPFPEMTFEEAAVFTSRFLPSWNMDYLKQLLDILQLPLQVPYQQLSRGQQRKFYLALTLAPCPEVLLLDDPAQGLDVSVRREFIQSIIPLLSEQQSTVVFSSHVMSDVERLADEAAIIDRGRLVVHESLDSLKEGAAKIVCKAGTKEELNGTIRRKENDGIVTYTVLNPDSVEIKKLEKAGAILQQQSVSLEDLFLDYIAAVRQ